MSAKLFQLDLYTWYWVFDISTKMDVPFFCMFLISFLWCCCRPFVMLLRCYIFSKYSLYDGCLLVTHRINVDIGFGIYCLDCRVQLRHRFFFSVLNRNQEIENEDGKWESFLAKLKFSSSHTSNADSKTQQWAEKWRARERKLKAILWQEGST